MINSLSAKRTTYISVKSLAEELSTGDKQIYKILKEPEMKETYIKIGRSAIRIKKEKFFEILEKIYR